MKLLKTPIFSIPILNNIIILLPIIMLLLSEILHLIAPSTGIVLKFLGLAIMILYCLFIFRTNKWLAYLTILFIPLLIYHYLISFNYNAALEEFIRYLFPIIVIFYSYAIKEKFPLLLKFFIFYFVLNILAQILNYTLWLTGIKLWYTSISEAGYENIHRVYGVMRATGVTGFFGLFGFMSLITYFLIETFYEGKFKRLLLILSFLGIFASIAYKTIVVLFVLIFLFSKKKFQIILCLIALSGIFVVSFPEKSAKFMEGAVARAQLYIFEGNSARSESYRVMFSDTGILGEGLGAFGGPASVTYNSPFYQKVNFDWYGLKLATTDTYFPHLFIEIGLIGGLIYLAIFFTPFMRKKINRDALKMLFIIYFALFFDSIFSYSINNTGFLIFSLLLAFPLVYYNSEKKMVGNE
ncbi:hypothetical protein [Mesonia aestuariivivens]|uniref:O-antigen ligase domain-containing protein n=1 Tax=Mesonia aestuariivivens TaxID=2796128 RepID=A0ABS6W0Z4_9FLAO|nr:hypothetical protein [Mesonia aestuariivivens]MBW2961525.1 hypothetical protein [Mesonia aestuariivivens]